MSLFLSFFAALQQHLGFGLMVIVIGFFFGSLPFGWNFPLNPEGSLLFFCHSRSSNPESFCLRKHKCSLSSYTNGCVILTSFPFSETAGLALYFYFLPTYWLRIGLNLNLYRYLLVLRSPSVST